MFTPTMFSRGRTREAEGGPGPGLMEDSRILRGKVFLVLANDTDDTNDVKRGP